MKRLTLLLSIMLFALVGANAQGFETFDNLPIGSSTSYKDRTWEGDNGVSWTATDSRADKVITGQAVTLRSGTLTNNTPVEGGCGTITFKYARTFSGNSILKLYVNEVQYGGDIVVSSEDATETTIEVDVVGDISIKFENTGGKRTSIDDVSWTSYGASTELAANFTADATEIFVSNSVAFASTVTNGTAPYTYSWEFDGDNIEDSSDENPSFTYATAGTYTVSLQVTDANSEVVTKTEVDFIIVSEIPTAPTATLPYEEIFDADLGSCTNVDIAGVKSWYVSNGSAGCNGYNGSNPEEHWLVLPAINFNDYTYEVISFDATSKYGTADDNNYLKLYYSDDYDGVSAVNTATWSELSIAVFGASNAIDLSSLVGSQVSIAFKYYSTNSPTSWTLDNIKIEESANASPVLSSLLPISETNFELGVGFDMSVVVAIDDAGGIDSVLLAYGDASDAMLDTLKYTKAVDSDMFSIASVFEAVGTRYCRCIAYANNGEVTQSDIIVLYGVCPAIATPVANEATEIMTTNFLANWDAVVGADKYMVNVWTETTSAVASDLFFSEYCEGSSDNKYLEIYNGTAFTVDLSEYALAYTINTPDVSGEYESWTDFGEGASIAPGGVYILCDKNAVEEIIEKADTTKTQLSNGDDGYALVKGTEENYVIVDMIGDFNADPGSGWTVAGVNNATKDHTLVRKSFVMSGCEWSASVGTDASDSQWEIKEKDDFTNLGNHTFEGGMTKTVIETAEILGSITAYEVTSLDLSTTYKYDVQAINAYGCSSDKSDVISVTTGVVTSVDAPQVLLNVYTTAQAIVVNTSGVQTVSVYDISGRLVLTQQVNNQATLQVASGLYVVRVANEVTKVVVK